MNDYQRKNLTAALYDTLMQMRTEGKNDNMLRNAYIKFMCWLYYKFERVVNLLGENTIPKILYEGTVSTYELKLITMLSKSGCDVVLLQYQGDNAYAAVDRGMAYSDRFDQVGLGAFPEGFSMKMLRKELEERSNIERLYGTPPKWMNCTNAWMEGSGLLDIVKPAAERGSDSPRRRNNPKNKINAVRQCDVAALRFSPRRGECRRGLARLRRVVLSFRYQTARIWQDGAVFVTLRRIDKIFLFNVPTSYRWKSNPDGRLPAAIGRVYRSDPPRNPLLGGDFGRYAPDMGL